MNAQIYICSIRRDILTKPIIFKILKVYFSIVTPSFKEPVPGWVDSLNGPVGVIVAAGKGVIRSMLCSQDFEAEVVPVDIAINALILIAWRRATSE